jgi:hypothetical protein
MKQERPMVVLAAVIVQVTLLFAPAQGQESHNNWLADLQGGIAKSQKSSQENKAIQRSVLDELDRETSGPELQGDLRENEGYDRTSDNIHKDLRAQADYRRYPREENRNLDLIIRQIYNDVLQREPDEESLRYYRNRMTQDGWTESDVREDLRSKGYIQHENRMSRREAERMVRRAYLDVLGREPDRGAEGWVDKVLRDRWTEQDVVRALRDSDEYRRGGRMTRRRAEQMVRRAYLDVLGREPDPGAEGWVDKVLRDRWTEQDVVRALRDSDEYRRRRR